MWPRSWRLGLEAVSRRSSASARSRLGWNFKRLALALASRLNVLVLASVSTLEGLGLGLGLGCKHSSITHIKLCLNMPLRFSLSSRLPPLLFRTTSVLGMMWMWPRSWRLGLEAVSRRSSATSASTRSRLRVGTPRPRLGLELWRPWSRSRLGLNCQRIGLGLGLGLQGLGLASDSTKKASCTYFKQMFELQLTVTGACRDSYSLCFL